MKTVRGQRNKGRYAFIHTVLNVCVSLKRWGSIDTNVLVHRDNMNSYRMVFTNLANDLGSASDKKLMTSNLRFRTAQADHELRFAFSEIGQQGMRVKSTCNNGGHTLNIINSSGII